MVVFFWKFIRRSRRASLDQVLSFLSGQTGFSIFTNTFGLVVRYRQIGKECLFADICHNTMAVSYGRKIKKISNDDI